MGDRLAHCQSGVERIVAEPKNRLLACSGFYETEPVDFTDQDWFINAVVQIETALSPQELLHFLKTIQFESGRKESMVRFGPRVLDLDILLYDDWILNTAELTIPHPRMHKRRFVLVPICDINPEILHPVLGCSIRQLLLDLGPEHQEIKKVRC